MTISAPYDAVATLRIARRAKRIGATVPETEHAMATPGQHEDRLWSEMTTRFAQASPADMRVLLVGFEQTERAQLRNALRSLGVAATAASPCVQQLPSIARMGLAFSYVIVNLDAYPSTEDAIDALLAFRLQVRNIVVIAASAEVSDDDLSLERATICDVTLRMSLTERRLLRCLVVGHDNNLELHKRRLDATRRQPRSTSI
jgi:hypothetical protein